MRRSALVVAAWVTAAVALFVLAPSLTKVGVQSITALLPSSSPSQRAQDALSRAFPDDPTLNSAVVVFSRRGGLLPSDRVYVERLDAFLSSPGMRQQVSQIQSPTAGSGMASILSSADGSADLVVLGLQAAPSTPQANAAVARIRAWLQRTAPPGLAHPVTGTEAIGADEVSGTASSFAQTAIISVLLVLAILLLVYRSLVAALVPLVTIGISYVVAQGLIAVLAAHGLKVASLAAVFMVVMVFGAGTDYCLFLVSRYRQELASGPSRSQALGKARAAVAPVLVASGATVILAFLSELTAQFGMYRTMGPAIGVAIAVTVVAGLTLTPAMLALLGRWAFWPASLTGAGAGTPRTQRWERIAAAVSSHPKKLSLAVIAVLAAASSGTFWLHQSYDLLSEVPASSDSAAGATLLAKHFPSGDLAPIEVLIQTSQPIRTPDRLAAIDRLTDELKTVPGVSQVRSATQPSGAPITANAPAGQLGGIQALKALGLDPDKVDVTPLYTAMASPQGLRLTEPVLTRYPQLGRQVLGVFYATRGASTRLLVAADGDPFSSAALRLVPELQDATAASIGNGPLAGASILVGGSPAAFHDISVATSTDFHHIAAIVVAVILLVLCLLLRSVVAPVYLLGTVLLSYAASLGLTVGVFSGLLGRGGLPFWLPLLLFVILVALGADYNIFLTGRMREALNEGASPAQAALVALVQTGPVITSAGLILAGTFFALMFAPLEPLSEAGFAVTVGVLIDTFVVRTALVPSLTIWAGEAAFWPPSWAEVPARARRAFGDLEALALLGAIVVVVSGVAAVAVHSPNRAASMLSSSERSRLAAGTALTDRRTGTPVVVSQRQLPQPGSTTSGPPTTVTRSASPSVTVARTAPSTPAPVPTTVAGPAGRIVVPAVGSWAYHLSGSRRIGAAGSTQPFSEDVATQVSQVSGDSRTAVMRLYTSSNAGTQDDQRRYGPDQVDWLSTQVSSTALSYGGTYSTPIPLVYWPPTIGSSWTTTWTTGDTSGKTTTTITGTRQARVAGHAYTCYVSTSDSTFSGSVQGTQQITSCWIPQLGMSAEDQENEQGTYNGVSFYASTDAVLEHAP